MRFITLGKTDIKVSVIGLGTRAIGGWMWGGTDEKRSVRAGGYRLRNKPY